jgi:hydrogenase 3 maturation protease
VPELSSLLKKAKNLLFIGVGNVLKQDDGVGVVISRQIEERPNIRSLTVEVSMENYIGKINSLAPDVIVIVDCMELARIPGTSRLVDLEEIEDLTFNTHNISLGRLRDFFEYPTYVLGIQPESIEFGDQLSPSVHESAKRIIQQINQQNS